MIWNIKHLMLVPLIQIKYEMKGEATKYVAQIHNTYTYMVQCQLLCKLLQEDICVVIMEYVVPVYHEDQHQEHD